MSECPETLLNTDVLDLKITGQHAAIPQWLLEPESDLCGYVVALDLGGSGSEQSEATRDEQ